MLEEENVPCSALMDQHEGHETVCEKQKQLEETRQQERENDVKLLQQDSEVEDLLSEPEPKTREEFLKYSRELTLDPNTAHRRLVLSEGNRRATLVEQDQPHPDHTDRFSHYDQILSTEALIGRCYWEVEWSGRGEEVRVGVAYGDMGRAGESDECRLGFNNKSWALDCFAHTYSFWHDKKETSVLPRLSCRVGVYLDHRAGVLSFYSVSDTMTLLHRVQTTFTQPLHAALRFYDFGDSAEFIKLK